MASNEGRPATIVGHSLGCLVSLYFIMGQDSDWLHKHVNSFIAISAPWAGSITALKGSHFSMSCVNLCRVIFSLVKLSLIEGLIAELVQSAECSVGCYTDWQVQ